jgi:[acyl-carrier-protein] S-malonyltransferase
MDLPESARLGLLFSGQGSQKAGMGAPWRDTDGWALVDTISDGSGHDVADLLLRADDETLRRTDRAQIATFALELVAHASFVEQEGKDRDVAATAGHSLGEYAALTAAGILDVEGGSRLVAARGAAMLSAAAARPGTMVAIVGAPTAAIEAVLTPLQAEGVQVWIANLNAPDQTVVAGDQAGIEAATEAVQGTGKVVALAVGGAFHSPFMAGAERPLRDALTATRFAPGSIPVVANVDGEPHPGGPAWVDLLTRQLTAPVRWTDSIRTMLERAGCEAFVEIGPGSTLSNLVKRIARGIPTARVPEP